MFSYDEKLKSQQQERFKERQNLAQNLIKSGNFGSDIHAQTGTLFDLPTKIQFSDHLLERKLSDHRSDKTLSEPSRLSDEKKKEDMKALKWMKSKELHSFAEGYADQLTERLVTFIESWAHISESLNSLKMRGWLIDCANYFINHKFGVYIRKSDISVKMTADRDSCFICLSGDPGSQIVDISVSAFLNAQPEKTISLQNTKSVFVENLTLALVQSLMVIVAEIYLQKEMVCMDEKTKLLVPSIRRNILQHRMNIFQ